jgi:hypothetical protein
VAVLGALILATGPAPPARADGPVAPDLVADPPARPVISQETSGAGRLLLRFDGFIHNAGAGPLEIDGSRAASTDPMQVDQRLFFADSTPGAPHFDVFDMSAAGAELVYETADGHQHFHLHDAARYSLWSSDRTAEVAPSMKVGFCMGDSQHVGPGGPSSAVYTFSDFCGHLDPTALTVQEGISPGWRDVYTRTLPFQWIDISDVQPGTYWLRADVDPDGFIAESDEVNAPAYSTAATTIPGYVAGPVAAGTVPGGGQLTIALAATAIGGPGPLAFRVVTAPAHGTLDVAPGATFAGPQVVYRPAPGYRGPDAFTYAAVVAGSPYPRTPATATVSLDVGAAPTPSVLISGAPASLATGHSAQLAAAVANDAPGVSWTVDGVPGGTARAGRITADGVYTAPSAIPPGGTVVVAARSASGAQDERVVRIVPSVEAMSLALPFIPRMPRAGERIGRPTLAVVEGTVVAAVRTGRRGTLTLRVLVGRRLVVRCRAVAPARRVMACRELAPAGVAAQRLRLVATLAVRGRIVATRRLRGARVVEHHG